MNFPIQSKIKPVSYGPKGAQASNLLIIGNAGEIPPSFQWAGLADDGSSCASGVSKMTDEQWNQWTDQDSETYILACVAQNEGFEIVATPTAVEEPAAPKKKTRR